MRAQQAYGFFWITPGRSISTANRIYKNPSSRPSSWVLRYILTWSLLFFAHLKAGTLDSIISMLDSCKGWWGIKNKTTHYLSLNSEGSLAGRGKTWMMARQAYVTQISILFGSHTQNNTYLPFIDLHLSPWRPSSTPHSLSTNSREFSILWYLMLLVTFPQPLWT